MAERANDLSPEERRRRSERARRREEGSEEEQYTSDMPQDKSRQSILLQLEGEGGEDQPLGADERLDRVSAEDNAEVVMNEMSEHTEDQEILDDFAERQMMPTDEQGMTRRMREHHSETPDVTAGDVDAAWNQAEDVGEETPSVEPMPDHDRVDEIGAALGLTYEDGEPLDFAEKVWRRDEERFEMMPESATEALENEGLDLDEDEIEGFTEDIITYEEQDRDEELYEGEYEGDAYEPNQFEGDEDDDGYDDEEDEMTAGPINPLDFSQM